LEVDLKNLGRLDFNSIFKNGERKKKQSVLGVEWDTLMQIRPLDSFHND